MEEPVICVYARVCVLTIAFLVPCLYNTEKCLSCSNLLFSTCMLHAVTKQRLMKVKSMNIIYQHNKQTPHLCMCVWFYAVIVVARHFHLHSYCLLFFLLSFLCWASFLSEVSNHVLVLKLR